MGINEKYRRCAIIGLVLHLFTLAVLFVTIWNNLSLHPETNIGPIVYVLLLAAVIFAIASFVLYFRHTESASPVADDTVPVEVPSLPESTAEPGNKGFPAPYEVDLDMLAERIIPRSGQGFSLEKFIETIMINMASEFEITQGIFYLKNNKTGMFEAMSTYACASHEKPASFAPGEGLTGQAAKSRKILSLENLPDDYLDVVSGLGHHKARQLIIIPVLVNKETIGIIEISSFRKFGEEDEWVFKNLAKIIGNVLINRINLKNPQQ